MMKRISLLLLTFLTGFALMGQNSKVSSAITYLENGELDRALDAIETAIVHEKTAIQAKTWFYRGRVFSAIGFDQTGNFADLANAPLDSALSSFNMAMTMPDVKKVQKLMLLEYQNLQFGFFNMGANAFQGKDYQTAHDAFSKSSESNMKQIEIDPNVPVDTGVIFNIGLTAQRLGNLDEAIGIYKKLVDMKYNEPYVYSSLAQLYKDKGMIDEAIAVINAGREAYPTDQSLIITELNFYLAEGRVEEIVNKLKEAISLDPENVELHFALGNAYTELVKTAVIESGTPAESVKACLGEPDTQEQIDNKGGGAEKWTYGKLEFTMVEGKVSDIEGDITQYNKVIEQCNDEEKKDAYFEGAVNAYKEALALDPENFDNNLYLGALFYNTAIELNKRIINLPLDAEDEYNKLVEERNELYGRALPYFEKAHEINPEDIPTMQALKEIYAKQNNFDKMNEIKTKLGE